MLHNTLHRNIREFPPPAPARHRWPQVEIKSLMFVINIFKGPLGRKLGEQLSSDCQVPAPVCMLDIHSLVEASPVCGQVGYWRHPATAQMCLMSRVMCPVSSPPGFYLLLLATSAPLPTADTIFPGKNQGQLIKHGTGSTHRHRHQANIEFVNMFGFETIHCSSHYVQS